MRLRIGLLIIALSLAIWPGGAGAVQGIDADLYLAATDANGTVQVYRIDSSNSIAPLTTAENNVTDFEVLPDGTLVFTTLNSLTIGDTAVTSGGPLDSSGVALANLAVSPGAGQVAVIALTATGTTDPAEGLWLYDTANGSWTLMLNSVRNDPITIYTGVTWAISGDRLILDADFGDGTNGIVVHHLNTGQNLPFNEAGTGNIQSAGYGRASLSLDGTTVLLSDVPDSPNGNGFIVDVNNTQRVIPLGDESLGPRYLSHATPIANGTAFFIRDFGNDIPTSEVWQLSTQGARVALGSIPHRELGGSVAWTPDGVGLAYIELAEPGATTGTLRVFQRVEDNMEAIELPEAVNGVSMVKWAPSPGLPSATFTAPVFDFLDEEQTPHYRVRLQWPDSGAGEYEVGVQPGFDGQEAFTVDMPAAQINRMPCGTVFTVTLEAPYSVSTPRCDVDLYPVTADPLYPRTAGQMAATTEAAPAESDTTTEAAPADTEAETTTDAAPADTPAEAAEPLPPGTDQGGPATVGSVSVAEPVAEGALSDGRGTFALDLSWAVPEQRVPFFLVAVSPPFGENQRDRVPVRAQADAANVSTTISGLVCGETYTFVVQSISDDGITVLSNSEPVTVPMPACE